MAKGPTATGGPGAAPPTATGGPGAPGPGAPAPKTPAGPSPAQKSAYDLLKSTLANWGLSDLYNYAVKFLQQGLTQDEITVELQNTKEYKARFAGNAIREANGLGSLSPADYIAAEESYRQVLQQNGLPAGFYSSNKDFDQWIGQDVSPSEVQSRAQIASAQYLQAPQQIKDYWTKLGLTPGQAVASILDPTHESLADLQTQANEAQLGGTAAEYGINLDTTRAKSYAQNQVSLSQAQQAYQQIAQFGATDAQNAQRFGLTFNTNDELDSLLGTGTAQANEANTRNVVNASEGAQFAGRGGASVSSLDPGADY